eukprot:1751286-Rhodomonas_salina.1
MGNKNPFKTGTSEGGEEPKSTPKTPGKQCMGRLVKPMRLIENASEEEKALLKLVNKRFGGEHGIAVAKVHFKDLVEEALANVVGKDDSFNFRALALSVLHLGFEEYGADLFKGEDLITHTPSG